jgi:iron complex outermembrane receptor protein
MKRLAADRPRRFWQFRSASPNLLPTLLFGMAAGWTVSPDSARADTRADAGATATDGNQSRTAAFDVPAGALENALNTFARQAGITLSFDPALVRERHSAALQRGRTVTEGLAELLSPHRLEAVSGVSGAYAVRPATAVTGVADHTLPALTVTARGQRADGEVHGYVAQRSASATRTDTALLETPRALTVVTRAQMDDQAVHTVEQSLRYSAGVLTEVSGYDPRFASLTVRGFAPAEYLDSFRLPTASLVTRWLVEPQGLERVELQKGPGAAFDPSAPGGSIHMVSKRPSADAVREASLSVGNRNRYQGSFDLGGALNDDASLLWRLNGVLRDSAGQTDFSRDDRAFIAPSLTWKPSSRTTVTLLAEATRDRLTPKSRWPEEALVTPNPDGRIPRERFVGEPGFDHYNRDAFSLTYLLEHRLDAHWTLRQNARHAALDVDYRQVAGTGLLSDMRTLERMAEKVKDTMRNTTLDTQLEGRFRTGPVAHTLVMGLAYQRQVSTLQGSFEPAAPLDAFVPIYGAPVPEPRFHSAALANTLTQVGIHVQDQMRAGPWSLGLAVRQDRARSRYGPALPVSLGTDTQTTYTAGLVYLAPNGLAPYLSYSTSFTPLTGTIASGEPLKPELGRQFEVGLKYRPPGMDALFTVSMFDLRKNNAVSLGPDVLALYSQTGQVRTRGPEFEARAALTRQLKLVGSYTLLDARVTRSLAPAELGKQPLNTARQTAALWLDYRFAAPALRGWSIGGGVRHVGRVPAAVDNSRYNPAYTLVDAALRYERGPYTFSLNATNLFDKNYVAGYGQYFGQGRTLQAKAAFRW